MLFRSDWTLPFPFASEALFVVKISKPWWILLIISNVMLFWLENMPTTIIIILCLLKTLILLLWFCSQKLVSAIVLFTSFIHSHSYHFYAIQYSDFTVYLSIIVVPSWKCQCTSLFLSLLCLSMFFSLPLPFKCICEANLYIHFQLGKVGFQHNRQNCCVPAYVICMHSDHSCLQICCYHQ